MDQIQKFINISKNFNQHWYKKVFGIFILESHLKQFGYWKIAIDNLAIDKLLFNQVLFVEMFETQICYCAKLCVVKQWLIFVVLFISDLMILYQWTMLMHFYLGEKVHENIIFHIENQGFMNFIQTVVEL